MLTYPKIVYSKIGLCVREGGIFYLTGLGYFFFLSWIYLFLPPDVKLLYLKLMIIFTLLVKFTRARLFTLCLLFLVCYTFIYTFVYTYPLSTSHIPRFIVFSYITLKNIPHPNGILIPLEGGGWGGGGCLN